VDDEPTAQMSSGATAATSSSELLSRDVLGVATAVHDAPSKCSLSVANGLSPVVPTAQTSRPLSVATALSAGSLAVPFAAGTMEKGGGQTAAGDVVASAGLEPDTITDPAAIMVVKAIRARTKAFRIAGSSLSGLNRLTAGLRGTRRGRLVGRNIGMLGR